MASRLRFILPYVAPLLAAIGWWWYATRRKKETSGYNEEEGAAASVPCSPSEGGGGAQKAEGECPGKQEVVAETHSAVAEAGAFSQSQPVETLGRVDTPSRTCHGGMAVDTDTSSMESPTQEETREPSVSPPPESENLEEAEAMEACLQHITEASVSGPTKELLPKTDSAAEERQPDGAACPSLYALASTAAGPQAEGNIAADETTVPSPEKLQTAAPAKDGLSRGGDLHELPAVKEDRAEATTTVCHIPTSNAPLARLEAEGPPQQDDPGTPPQGSLPVDPPQNAERGEPPADGLIPQAVSVLSQEVLVLGQCEDGSEEVDRRQSEQSSCCPPTDNTQGMVQDQVEQDNCQTSMEVQCHLQEGSSLVVVTEAAGDKESLSGSMAPAVCEVKEDLSRHKSPSPETTPSSLVEIQTEEEVTGTKDSGSIKGHLVDVVSIEKATPSGDGKLNGTDLSWQKSPDPETTPSSLVEIQSDKEAIGTEGYGSEDGVNSEELLCSARLPSALPEKGEDLMQISTASQVAEEQEHSPGRMYDTHQDESLQASLSGDKVQNGSHVMSEMETGHSGEITSAASQELLTASHHEDEEEQGKVKPLEQSSHCPLTNGKQCMVGDQGAQENGVTPEETQEGPTSTVVTEAEGRVSVESLSGSMAPAVCEVKEDLSRPKSPSPETTPSSLVEIQADKCVAGTKDSGNIACQLADVVSIEKATPDRDEKVNGTDLQNGCHLASETEVEHSGGSDVNGTDSGDSGCTSGTKADRYYSSQLTHPQNSELIIWEVQVPKHLVGRLIGKRGRYVSFLKQSSGAKVYISKLPYTEDFQICHIEGSKQQVDKALGLIGKKFIDLDLTNLYAPPLPATLPSLPITSWLLLPDGVAVEVTVVKIVTASHMFVQQPTHPSYPALSALNQEMLLCYSQPDTPALPSPTEGMICAAPVSDGAWRRAQVVSFFKESNEAEIRYVDYGGYERVQIDILRQIRSDFVTLPFQGAEVVLNNIKPLPGENDFSAEANAALEELTRGASLLAQVASYDSSGVPFIQMWQVVGDELVSVNRTLVERGFATWVESL